jgi:VanZ family protein
MIRPQPMRTELFRNWAPAVAWAALILYLSGQGGSSQNTGSWLAWLLGDVELETLFYINYSLRKLAHVIGYGILGFLNFRALQWRLPGWAIALAGVVAVADELHQATNPLRTASAADIGFDLCGAALAVMVARGVRRSPLTVNR